MGKQININAEPTNNLYQPNNILIRKRGRPQGYIRQQATSFITTYPKSPTIVLHKFLLGKLYPKTIRYDYTLILKQRVIKSQTVINNNNNSKLLHFNDSQLSNSDVLDLIEDYIQHRYALDIPSNKFIKRNKHFFSGRGYTNQPKDNARRLRTCIQRLKNRETFVMKNHIHYHNNIRQNIEYHIGDHILTKYLCNLLGLKPKMSFHLGKGHFISTDSSGLDICHLSCLKKILDYNIESNEIELNLMQDVYPSGKIMYQNQVVYEWTPEMRLTL